MNSSDSAFQTSVKAAEILLWFFCERWARGPVAVNTLCVLKGKVILLRFQEFISLKGSMLTWSICSEEVVTVVFILAWLQLQMFDRVKNGCRPVTFVRLLEIGPELKALCSSAPDTCVTWQCYLRTCSRGVLWIKWVSKITFTSTRSFPTLNFIPCLHSDSSEILALHLLPVECSFCARLFQ